MDIELHQGGWTFGRIHSKPAGLGMLPASLAEMPTEGEAIGMQNEPRDLGGVIQVLNRHSTDDRLP